MRWFCRWCSQCTATSSVTCASDSCCSWERAPLGFEPRSLLTFALTAPGTKYPTAENLRVLRQQLATRFAALPGVVEVALGRSVPMDDDYGGIGLKLREAPRPEPGELTIAVYYPISPGYIKSMGIALLAGREFTPSDGSTRRASPSSMRRSPAGSSLARTR